jgi:hypothetical protein
MVRSTAAAAARRRRLRYDIPGLGPTWVRSWHDRNAARALLDAAAAFTDELFARAEMSAGRKCSGLVKDGGCLRGCES